MAGAERGSRHLSAAEARPRALSNSDASTSDSEGSEGKICKREPNRQSTSNRDRKRSRSQSRDNGSSSSEADSRDRSKSRHKKKKKDEKKSKKKKHKKHKHKSKDREEATGPVQLSKFLQDDKGGKEGRYSVVSGQKIKMKVDKSQADIDAARRRSELLAALNGFYD